MAKASVTLATITRAVKAVQAAGLPVERVEVDPDGKVIVIMDGSGEPKNEINEWDKK